MAQLFEKKHFLFYKRNGIVPAYFGTLSASDAKIFIDA